MLKYVCKLLGEAGHGFGSELKESYPMLWNCDAKWCASSEVVPV